MKEGELSSRKMVKLRCLYCLGVIIVIPVLLGNLLLAFNARTYSHGAYAIPLCVLTLGLLWALMLHRNWARLLWVVVFMLLLPLIPVFIKIEPVYANLVQAVIKDQATLALMLFIGELILISFGVILATYLLLPQTRALFTSTPMNMLRLTLLGMLGACTLGLGLVALTCFKVSFDAVNKKVWLEYQSDVLSTIIRHIHK